MSHQQAAELFQQAVAAAQAGARSLARCRLMQANQRQQTPLHWLWLAAVADSPATALHCLDQALVLDPQHPAARAGRDWYQSLLQRDVPSPGFDLPRQPVTATQEVLPNDSDAATTPPAQQMLSPRPLPQRSSAQSGPTLTRTSSSVGWIDYTERLPANAVIATTSPKATFLTEPVPAADVTLHVAPALSPLSSPRASAAVTTTDRIVDNPVGSPADVASSIFSAAESTGTEADSVVAVLTEPRVSESTLLQSDEVLSEQTTLPGTLMPLQQIEALQESIAEEVDRSPLELEAEPAADLSSVLGEESPVTSLRTASAPPVLDSILGPSPAPVSHAAAVEPPISASSTTANAEPVVIDVPAFAAETARPADQVEELEVVDIPQNVVREPELASPEWQQWLFNSTKAETGAEPVEPSVKRTPPQLVDLVTDRLKSTVPTPPSARLATSSLLGRLRDVRKPESQSPANGNETGSTVAPIAPPKIMAAETVAPLPIPLTVTDTASTIHELPSNKVEAATAAIENAPVQTTHLLDVSTVSDSTPSPSGMAVILDSLAARPGTQEDVSRTESSPVGSIPLRAAAAAEQRTVLVVDDSATIRRVVADVLQPRGYRVIEAADGIAGIREIASQRPDLILLDISMPRLDGYRLCRLVKGHAATKDIPVVMLSGKDGTFDKLRGRLAGSSDYITKPFETNVLIDKVERYLRQTDVSHKN